jgi:GNAT superfamily N-acetyltransferase
MTDQLLDRNCRPLAEEDYPRVLEAAAKWWDVPALAGREAERLALLPRLFFQHFTDSSFLLERDDEVIGFLIGFLSQSRPAEAYIHFVGVAPDVRRHGLGALLYKRFFALARARQRTEVHCVTSPGNTRSLAFHRGLGFELEPGDYLVDGVPVKRDYDGPGLDRIAFVRRLSPDDS